MLNGQKKIALSLCLIFSTIGSCLYIGLFSFYLVKIHTSPVIISVLIGTTALSSVFWGPFAGRLIDRTPHKFLWLFIGKLACGAFVFSFGNLQTFSLFWTSVTVLGFSLTLNLSTIISNQYLLPMIDDHYETAVAFASRINGLAVCICGISMALLYDVFQPIIFFSVSASAYLLSGLLLFLFFPKKLPFFPDPETDHPSTRKVGVYRQTFHLLKKNWFLALAMCILAFTETSFNTNFDVIAFSLGTTPFAAVFLLGAFSGGLDTCASWLYPKIIGSTGIHFRWVFFLVSTACAPATNFFYMPCVTWL